VARPNTAAGGAAEPDGRQGRTLRSRQAICDACLDLVQEGVLQPSADQVADRAGLSRRSIFNHFSDLTALYDAVVKAGIDRCAPLLEEFPPGLPARARAERLAAMCARFHEATTPFRRSMIAQGLVGPFSERALRVSRELLREERDGIAALFAPELAALDAGERAELAEAIAAAVSPATFDHLRSGRGLSAARARGVMQRSVTALLRDAGF
jgi:TetR/AcrR family transcriptional regulator, regulator of autoinduction and epiphytic fitness